MELGFNLDNLVQQTAHGEFNAISFSVLGISTVFVGLVIISLYIRVLPLILGLLEKKQTSEPVSTSAAPAVQAAAHSEDDDLHAAIALAIHLYESEGQDLGKFTFDTTQGEGRQWHNALQVSSMMSRQTMPLGRQ